MSNAGSMAPDKNFVFLFFPISMVLLLEFQFLCIFLCLRYIAIVSDMKTTIFNGHRRLEYHSHERYMTKIIFWMSNNIHAVKSKWI